MASLQPRPGETVSDWKNVVSDKPSMTVGLLRELTELKDVPEPFREVMWAFMSQEDVWGYLDEKGIRMAEEIFLAAWDFYEYVLPNDADPKMQLHYLNALHKFKMRTSRARDGFERKQENTTIAQSVMPSREAPKQSWFGRTIGRFF